MSNIDTDTIEQARPSQPKFDLGTTTATPTALGAFVGIEDELQVMLRRHHCGDWGDVCPDDVACNELALIEGTRLWSRYETSRGEKILIITEWDRSLTTVLLPEDY